MSRIGIYISFLFVTLIITISNHTSQTLSTLHNCYAGQVNYRVQYGKHAHKNSNQTRILVDLAMINITSIAIGIFIGIAIIASVQYLIGVIRKRSQQTAPDIEFDRLLTEIKNLNANLHTQATRDPLTNLFTRAYLLETLDREFSRAKREGKAISLAIADIDALNEINAEHGYNAGDLVLQALGDLLSANIRREDVASRYGGEEFALLLYGASREDAMRRMEKLCQAFSETQVFYAASQVSATISVGIAVFPEHGSLSETIILSAEQALAQAKRTGGNCVQVFLDPSPKIAYTSTDIQ